MSKAQNTAFFVNKYTKTSFCMKRIAGGEMNDEVRMRIVKIGVIEIELGPLKDIRTRLYPSKVEIETYFEVN